MTNVHEARDYLIRGIFEDVLRGNNKITYNLSHIILHTYHTPRHDLLCRLPSDMKPSEFLNPKQTPPPPPKPCPSSYKSYHNKFLSKR